MSAISERLRAARGQWVAAAGAEFFVLRPRALELVRWAEQGNDVVAIHAVADWRGVSAGMVTGNGDATAQPFDADLRDEWLPDRPDILLPVWQAVQQLLGAHAARVKADEKN